MSEILKSFPLEITEDAHLLGPDLWLDPHRPRPFAFVSHAHADHARPHQKILCSPETRQLLISRYGYGSDERPCKFISPGYGEPIPLGEDYEGELFPAGHITGSAMLRVTDRRSGHRLLHTGDFKTRPTLTCLPYQPVQADIVIMETTFGQPAFVFPETDSVIAQMQSFIQGCHADGLLPILLAYSLGKSQEVAARLAAKDRSLTFYGHRTVIAMHAAVQYLGYESVLPDMLDMPSELESAKGGVLFLPPSAARSRKVRNFRNHCRLAMISGWGINPNAKFRYQCDEVFPLSDHADFSELSQFVKQTGCSFVYTIHGSTADFSRHLRDQGIESWPLQAENQMELSLRSEPQDPTPAESEREPEVTPHSHTSWERFVNCCSLIRDTMSRLEKRDLLASFLQELPDEELPIACHFFTARPFPSSSGKTVQIGSAGVRQALLRASGFTLSKYRSISSHQGDSGRVARAILEGLTRPEALSLIDVHSSFTAISEARVTNTKVEEAAEMLLKMSPEGAQIYVGILLGDLRIGLKDGLVEEAIIAAFAGKTSEIRAANMLTGDIGLTASLAKEGRLAEAAPTWFQPVRCMLASPTENVEAAIAKIEEQGDGDSELWLENKFDGIRAQWHCDTSHGRLFSRDLKDMSETFPELIEQAGQWSDAVILDGEIIAYADGEKLTFFDLQKRLGRRFQGDLFLGEAIPIRFVIFDLLGLRGESLLAQPLAERRRQLEQLALPSNFELAPVHRVSNTQEVETKFQEAKKAGDEGLILKVPSSPYTLGRRGQQWLKVKHVMPTLDCVVTQVEQGHGKRSHLLSDYTFSLRDQTSSELRVIGKAYSGLTDEELENLTEWFEDHTLEKSRRKRVVEPAIIIEVAFDTIRRSSRHESGMALRFPRIVQIRDDKGLNEIDTIQYAESLLSQTKAKVAPP